MAERSVVQVTSDSWDPSVEELRQRVSARFWSLGVAAGALQARVRHAADLGSAARRHPTWVLGAAAAAGLLAGGLVRRRRRRRSERLARSILGRLARAPKAERSPKRVAAVSSPVVGGALSVLTGVLVRRLGRRLSEELLRPRPRLIAPRRAQA